MAYGIPAASLPPTAPPWPSQQRCPPERHAAMARMQQRREQRSSFGDEDFTMGSKGTFEEPRRPRSRGARHTEVLEDSRRFNDEVEPRRRPEREKLPPKSADRRRHAEEELRNHHVVEEPPRSSRRHREEVEEAPKRRDRERDREIRERDRDLDRDRDMDRERRHEKGSRKKQQEEEDEPLPPEVAKADFSTLQQMIAKQIKEAEQQTELPELKPFDDDHEIRLREQRRKQREEEEQRRVEERKRLRKEREEARLKEIQEAQRQEEEEEGRKKQEVLKKKADEELQVAKGKAATKIQARYRGNCSRTGKKFASKPVEGNVKDRQTLNKTPDEEGDLLM